MSDTQKNLYKKIYGRAGERLAAKYLKRQGCKILKKNFAVKAGEIDIVALDGETLVFVEVKSRQSDSFGEPAEAVDAKKRKKYGLVARAYLQMEQNGEPFADFVWSFVNHQPQVTQATTLSEIPTSTPASDALSKALKKRGFKFVGTTICYSFMQACGLVNDHVVGCCCYPGNKP